MNKNPAPQDSEEYQTRFDALEFAIKSGVGHTHDDNNMSIVEANRIVDAAKKFETYLKGTNNVE